MVKWLRYCAHDQEVVGLNPAVYWMDVRNTESYYIEKKEIKVAKVKKKKKKLG